ncbi:NHLP family bacteriocin export ABC transporter permease/ATPase subunit [Dulcicalothrix desertica PCC 7102]|uniref:NHLP family bacteriocin export ABC transporter permease/ATPase subunit n=2 Tax=Dulcicalothrix desertica TaxID=32056 RepID=A0A3S1CU43_9CYAN|nr:NHLP bacteriocin export ABC transporter permease/ATPase subunit [Dulcicalothrix desertica]RUT08787.1 NHLP family bacteriocin export ABC transporter permease/ATPase subunit [Dulcicalothrix desertica PCC 7102]TWH44201.1 ATP-binding cassette subfamily C protein [Dulcicalothrix desertica PCC 7102]
MELQEQLYQLKGNEPILLNDPQALWQIQSGSISLFVVTVDNGIIQGNRRYLFSCNPGEALFGSLKYSDNQHRQILAVPIGTAELLKVNIQNINHYQNLSTLVKVWCNKCKAALNDEFKFNIDLTSNNIQKLLERLAQFHIEFFDCIDFVEQQEALEEIQRLQAREHLNRQVTKQALEELASSLNHEKQNSFLAETHDSPLLYVAGAVGKALGINIHPPASLDELKTKEPLEAIVRASKVRMRRVLLQENWWKNDCGAMVAFTSEDDRPIALLPVSPTSYQMLDPIEQTRATVNERRALLLSPVAYTFYRSLPNQVLNAKDLFKFILFGRSRDLVIILLTSIGAVLLGMVTPQATAIIMDNAIPDGDKNLIMQIGVGLLVTTFATTIFKLIQGFAILRVETASDVSAQAAVWDRLLRLPVSFFRQYTTGDLHNRVLSIHNIRRRLSGSTLVNLITGLFALFYLGQLFYYNVNLAIIGVLVAVVTVIIIIMSSVMLFDKVRPLLELEGDIFGQKVQLINGISKLRVAGAEERAFAAWSKKYSRQVKLEISKQKVEDSVTLINTVIPTLTNAALFWFTVQMMAPSQSSSVGLTIGTFLAFNTAFDTFIEGTSELSNTLTETLQVVPEWKRTLPILETLTEVNSNKRNPGILTGKIAMERVSFRYLQDKPLVLDNVSFSVEPGEFIAFVGTSGSGKSTLLRLLLGFENLDSGNIYYSGQDLSKLDIEAVRRQMGVVLQNGHLQSASIFDNIAGGANLTLDEAWEAAEMAGFASDIAMMPMDMHTIVSEGGNNLSGGQRQRLLIARALALKPKILLFDEATSALDNKTQAIVSESLDKLQVTRIVIAHRLSTIRSANRIYVLQAGRIIQQGTFSELALETGLFAQLMQRQIA